MASMAMSSPIVTSNGTKSGSGVVWIVELQDGGTGVAQLQAYDAVPSAGNSGNPGTLKLIHQWPIGDGMKFTPPGVGDNRLFLVDGRGRVLERRPLVVAQALQLAPLVHRRRRGHRDEARRLGLNFVDLATIRPVATDGQIAVVVGDDAPNRS